MKVTARKLHLYLGITATLILSALAVSGFILSTKVITENIDISSQAVGDGNLLQLLKHIEGKFEEVEFIQQTPAKAFIVQHRQRGAVHKSYIDIHTGEIISEVGTSPFYNWVQDFHRSLLMEKPGKVIVALTALILLILSISGLILYRSKQGGWRQLFRSISFEPSLANLHSIIGFISLIPLVVISLSGLYLSLITFGVVPSSSAQRITYPESPVELDAVLPSTLDNFKDIRLDEFREIIYPIPEDWFDVYAVKSHQNIQFFDQFTGEQLSKQNYQPAVRWSLFVLDLHSGEIHPALAVLFGISSLTIPFFGVTGLILWLRKRNTLNLKAFSNDNADVVILVGSETNTTWQFSHSLGKALVGAGHSVYIAAMNELKDFPNAKYLFAMSATYGDGDAPQNANNFLSTAMTLSNQNTWQYSVIGFGDSSFDKFCHFPNQIMNTLSNRFSAFLPFCAIDKQCPISFEKWGSTVSEVLGKELKFDDVSIKRSRCKFKVEEKTYFNQKKKSVVRLHLKSSTKTQFNSGDLLAIKPNKGSHERYYSIAKNDNGQLELYVSIKRPGLGSDYLNSLKKNQTLHARVINNQHFHKPKGDMPLILIGAGTGVAPFIGMIKQNHSKRVIDLYFGCQHLNCDFVIGDEIKHWKQQRLLTQCHVAFSKGQRKQYVQDSLQAQETTFIKRIQSGAVIMICGSQAMYESVSSVLDEMLTRHGLGNIETLSQQNRFHSEVY